MAYEGYGAGATGGGAGPVIHVTNLNSEGAGSLRAALQTAGARTIVFDVGGEIPLSIGADFFSPRITVTDGNVTIRGETAPAPGITLRYAVEDIAIPITPITAGPWNGPLLYFHTCSNIIISHIAIRCGIWPWAEGEPTSGVAQNMTCIQFGDSFNPASGVSNVVLDHCTFSDASGRAISTDKTTDMTISNCIIGPGTPGPTAQRTDIGMKGCSFHGTSTRISIANNVFAHSHSRMPAISSGRTDVRGNLICDWVDFGGHIHNQTTVDLGMDVEANWAGNTLIYEGLLGSPSEALLAADWRNEPTYGGGSRALTFFLDNPAQLNGTNPLDTVSAYVPGVGWTNVSYVGSQYQVPEISMPAVTVKSKLDVLAGVGRFPRDDKDTALMLELGYAPAIPRSVKRRNPIRLFGCSGDDD